MIAVISAVIGCVGVGIFIPTNSQFEVFRSTMCSIVDHEYETCDDQGASNSGLCYIAIWSVEYKIQGQTRDEPMFATITKKYKTPSEALTKLNVFKDDTNHTCYYHITRLTYVQWDEPASPRPYLIMMIVGYSFVFLYLVLMIFVVICYFRNK